MDGTLLGQYKPSQHLPETLFSTFQLFPLSLLKINAFPMWYEIWKEKQKSSANGGFELGPPRQEGGGGGYMAKI